MSRLARDHPVAGLDLPGFGRSATPPQILDVHGLSTALVAWLEARGIEELQPAGTLTYDQYDQVINAALHGQGIALGRMTLAEQYIKRKEVVALFGQSQKVGRGFHAVISKQAGKRPEVRKFVEWLQRELRG